MYQKKLHTLYALWLLLPTLLLAPVFSGCSDEDGCLPLPVPSTDEEETDNSLLYHEWTREHPYPKMNNQLYLNPPPLLVPEAVKEKGGKLQFALSRSAGFPDDGTTQLSEPVPWCMFNPHRTLESGNWYWRFRSVAADGTEGEWSETYRFEMTDDVPRFLTPDVATFEAKLPTGHPRLHLYLNDKAEAARQSIASHPEYKTMKNRATTAMKADYGDIASFYKDKASSETLGNYVNYLYQAYYLTGEEEYAEKLMEILRRLVSRPPTDKELFSAASNFVPTNIAMAHIYIYDLLFSRLLPSERQAVEELLARLIRYYYPVQAGKEETTLFDSHFWQQNMRVLFTCAYMLYDKATLRQEVLPALRYYYEVWTARAPGSGYNRDGVWHNSASYFNTNALTLYYMPLILGYITGSDFLAHPWYREAGRALLYSWPLESRSCGFGDGSNGGDAPTRVRLAFADFLARYTGDSYAQWYAGQATDLLRTDFTMRLDRMVNGYAYSDEVLCKMEKMIWYKDAGEVVMHSDLLHTEHNLALSFRSSRYGCTAHTYANQNAFNVLYKGVDVFRNTGYYLLYGSPHHITDSRHTRAHNTILVNGIGQGFTEKAYGDITRGICGTHITYCLGDASHAYADTCNLKSWLNNLAAAGITQTADNGFGSTPLTKYLRHVWMLHPDVAVVYDELEASEAVRWDWLLHSPTTFHIKESGSQLTTINAEKGFAAQGWLFSTQPFSTQQTDRFVTPPTAQPDPAYPDQWHLSATVEGSTANRFLFIMQVYDNERSPLPVGRSGNVFSIGSWHIEAELDTNRPAAVTITHDTEDVLFSYDSASSVQLPDGTTYRRQQPGSSILYETGNVQEQADYVPKHTRAVGK